MGLSFGSLSSVLRRSRGSGQYGPLYRDQEIPTQSSVARGPRICGWYIDRGQCISDRFGRASPRSRWVKWGPSVLGAFVKSLPPRPPGSSDGLEELLANCVEVLQP